MNLESDILSLHIKQLRPHQGDILISEPFLKDSPFQRSEICLVEHKENISTMGIVLNNVTRYTLGEALDGIHTNENIPLYCGGPLSNDRLFYLHTLSDIIPNSIEVTPGLYINGVLRLFKSYINSGGITEGKL